MPSPNEMTIAELEEHILRETAVSRQFFNQSNVTVQLSPYIRQWCIKNGMNERKTYAANPHTLAEAYRIGERYINGVNRNEDDKRFGTGRGGRGIRLDGFGDKTATVSSLLAAERNVETETPTYTPISNPVPTPASEVLATSTGAQPPMDRNRLLQMVAKVMDEVIPPKITAAKIDLARGIKTSVDTTVHELETRLSTRIDDDIDYGIRKGFGSENIQTLIETVAGNIAKIAAKDFIDNNVPRRLEIHVNGKPTVTLPSEPRHKIFDRCLKWLHQGEHVYLVGPAGTGKTFLFDQLAIALDRPLTVLGQAFTKYDFSGFMSPTGQYIATALRAAMEEGHVVGIDEIDMDAAPAIGFLNSLLANRYVAFPDKTVHAHPNFIVIAAANTYGRGATQDYIGRNPLDAASLDRFVYEFCDYDTELEKQIYGDIPWVSYVHRVRNAIGDLGLRHVVSMRSIKRGLNGIAMDLDADDVCNAALWRGLDADTVNRITGIAGKFILDRKPNPNVDVELVSSGPRPMRYIDEFLACIENNHKIRAMKILRMITPDLSLTDAKATVESIMNGWEPPPESQPGSPWNEPLPAEF